MSKEITLRDVLVNHFGPNYGVPDTVSQVVYFDNFNFDEKRSVYVPPKKNRFTITNPSHLEVLLNLVEGTFTPVLLGNGNPYLQQVLSETNFPNGRQRDTVYAIDLGGSKDTGNAELLLRALRLYDNLLNGRAPR